MTAAKDKGSRWERQVREWVRTFVDGRAYKPHEEGFEDVGDLHVQGGTVVLQAKDWKDWQSAIREGLDGAVRQAAAWDRKTDAMPSEAAFPAAVVKRARRPVEDAYVVMRLEDFGRLLRRRWDV